MRRTRTSQGGVVAALALGVALSAAAVGLPSSGGPVTAEAAKAERPNVILIVTDDQRLDELDKRTMPATQRLIAGKGTVFTNAIVPTPTCCPSRATILTGQYGHNNGVLANAPGYRALKDPSNTLPAWLSRAGYRTAHLGKYLNGYQAVAEPDTEVAPGWDEWHTMLTPRQYYDYALAVNGRRRKFGRKPGEHLTRVLNRRAARLVRQFARKRDPFYLQLDHFAPHTESGTSKGGVRCKGRAVPDPRDEDLLRDVKLRKGRAFNEKDVSDKPSFIRSRDRLDSRRKRQVAKRFRCRTASLRSVDRGVKKIVRTLKERKALDETVIMFISDNGYFRGEHRIGLNKTFPYEEALRVPLAIRAPREVIGGDSPGKVNKLVANLDIAPTILELARAEPCNDVGCRVMDGRPLVGVLRGDRAAFPGDRSLVLEYERKFDKAGLLCRYAGIRDPRRSYVEYTGLATGDGCEEIDEGELYDLSIDRFQLANLFRGSGGQSAVQRALAMKLDALRDCNGIAGRDPNPAGKAYCE